MRTLLLSTMLLVLVPWSAFAPWVGVLTWTWISIMNPHKLTYGFLFDFPVAAVVGGATLIGLFFTRNRRMPPANGVTLTLLAFVLWMCLTSAFAVFPDRVGDMFSKVMKIQLMIFVTMALIYERKHLDYFIWVIVLSLGFFGLKGGLFTLMHGGAGRVYGPPGGFMEGNNELALGLTMTVPLMYYLRSIARRAIVRHGLVGLMIVTSLSILGSQSRGAFLAIIAMAIYLWRFSERKVVVGAALTLIGFALIAFMPIAWEGRMDTIINYHNDGSAMGRINAWWMAWNLARHRFLGAGFDTAEPALFAQYAPNPHDIHAAHSIYFQVLGEHGFVGLALFLLLWWLTWRTAGWLRKSAKQAPGMESAAQLAAMIQVSLVGYFVGGAFLSLAYFDLPYDLLAVVVVLKPIIEARIEREAAVQRTAENVARHSLPVGSHG